MPKKENMTEEETIEYYEGLEEDKIRTIKTEKIDLEKNEYEFRLTKKTSDLEDSIKAHGQQFPVIVREIPETKPNRYELISGYRRVRTINKLGIPEVKAIVRELDDDQAYRISFMENEKRRNLTGVDKAHAIAKLRVAGKSDEEIKELYGIGDKQLGRYEQVGSFPDTLKNAISEGAIQTSHGLLLATGVKDHGTKVKLKDWVKRIEEEELSVRQLQKALNLEFGKPKKKPRYFEKYKKEGFRIFPMSYDPKNTPEDKKKLIADALRKALELIEEH